MSVTTGSNSIVAHYTTAVDSLMSAAIRRHLTTHQKTIQRTELIVLGSLFIAALVGNLCVLVWVFRRREKRTRMNMFIMHLAIADLATAIFQVLPEWLLRMGSGFQGNDFTCKIMKYLQIVSMYASTCVLLCVAFDRYMAIQYPMRSFKCTKKMVHVRIAVAWIVAMVLSIPQIVLNERPSQQTKCIMIKTVTLQFVRGYVTWYFISVLVIPTCLLIFFYGQIAKAIMKNFRDKNEAARQMKTTKIAKDSFAPRASSTAMISRAKIKTVKMTLVIVITYIVCWLPFFLVQMLGVWGAIDRNNIVSSVIHLVACLNSCTNPWIYFYFSGKFGKEIACIHCKNNRAPKNAPDTENMDRARNTTERSDNANAIELSRSGVVYTQTNTSKVLFENTLL